ncbi:hypothetical protein C0995_004481, partial [Termitomyces sp. Mi166
MATSSLNCATDPGVNIGFSNIDNVMVPDAFENSMEQGRGLSSQAGLEDTCCLPTPSLSDNNEELFKVEYHLHSGIPTKIGSYEDCFPVKPRPLQDFEPWKPFKSRLDFKIAELRLEAALNKSQLNCLIKLFHRAVACNDEDLFTLKNATKLKMTWEKAAELRTQVHEDTAKTGKKGFVNFKNAVWHEGSQIFLEKISMLVQT